jgi:RPA family protein
MPGRMPAVKVRIMDVVSGKYLPGSKEEMKPSYVITSFGQKVSRINIIASVTDKFISEDGNYSSITIDDGTDVIRVKAFKEDATMLKSIELGDMVLAIGKVKEFNGELYLNGEIVRKIGDPNYESMRRLEILNELVKDKKIIEEIKKLKDRMGEVELKVLVEKKFGMDGETLQFVLDSLKVQKEIDYKPKILELIDSLNEGEGIEIGKILELSDLPEHVIEKAINELLDSGVLYEPFVGRLKRA